MIEMIFSNLFSLLFYFITVVGQYCIFTGKSLCIGVLYNYIINNAALEVQREVEYQKVFLLGLLALDLLRVKRHHFYRRSAVKVGLNKVSMDNKNTIIGPNTYTIKCAKQQFSGQVLLTLIVIYDYDDIVLLNIIFQNYYNNKLTLNTIAFIEFMTGTPSIQSPVT